MNIVSISATGFRNLLLIDPQLAATIRTSTGQHKIFLGQASGNFLPPYILITKLYGGEENASLSRSFDMIFRIAGVMSDQGQAEELNDRIEAALVSQWPVLPDGWEPWAWITQGVPYQETRIIQDKPYHEMGAQYRIRAVKDKQ